MAATTRSAKTTQQPTYQRKTHRSQPSHHLTDPARLKHIFNTLTKAISAAPQGELQSWEDVKAYVEDFSHATGKAAIGMELCERDKEVRGFRFYLEQYPAERTSGSYLVKNLQAAGIDLPVDDSYFTPSSLAGVLGLESEEAPLELDTDEWLLDPLDNDDRSDAGNDTALDDDLTLQPNRPRSEQPVAHPHHESVGLIDQVITEDDPQFPQSKQPKQPSTSSAQKSFRPAERQNEAIAASVLDAANRATQGLTANGSGAVDGLNIAGGTGQLMTSTVAVAIALAKALDDPDSCRQTKLKKLANLAMQQAQRLDDLSDRAEPLLPPENLGTENLTADTHEPQPFIEPWVEASSLLTTRTNQLTQKIDPSLDRLEPLNLNLKTSLDVQINQIEGYLKQLSKRLDRLEDAITRLEEQVAQLQAPTPEAAVSEATHLDNADQYAETLWGYAQTLHTLGQGDEIALSDNKTLWVETQDNATRLLVSDANLNDIWFEAERSDADPWQVHTNTLSERDYQAILHLPQTPEQYAQLASAQVMAEIFQQQMPSDDHPISFAWTDHQGKPKYIFEMTEAEANGARSLTGYAANHHQPVFLATLSDKQPPQIQQCTISRDEIESLLRDLAPEAEQAVEKKAPEPSPSSAQTQRQLKRPRLPER
jgi:hypothetical protein